MKRLCTVCARSGSKGVPGKNLRLLVGKPLIVHSLEQARRSGLFAAIAVSSDGDEILQAAAAGGADLLVRRPPALADDRAPKLPAIVHCVEEAERRAGGPYDIVVDLDATSPLRLADDIAEAVALLENSATAFNVITGAPSRRSPYFNMIELTPAGAATLVKRPVRPIYRRQDAPATYDMNASVYAWRREALGEPLLNERTLLHVMPRERSIDIDNEADWAYVEYLMKLNKERIRG